MIGVVQGGIIDTPGLLERPVGRILCLADLYDQLASDAPIETRTDINRVITTVSDATTFTTQVALVPCTYLARCPTSPARLIMSRAPWSPCSIPTWQHSVCKSKRS